MKKQLIAIGLCVMMTLSLAACDGSGGSSASGSGSGASGDSVTASGTAAGTSDGLGKSTEEDGVVTIGYVGSDDACYPSADSNNDFIKQAMVYDKLFEVDDTTGEYTSRILKSWDWTDDKTLVMTLKDGITFSDGHEMTMDDVLFSLKNYIDQGQATDKYQYFQNIDFNKTTVSDDGKTLTLVYKQPYGPAERTLNVAIMEKDFTEQHEASDSIWYTAPVGSGPYEITDNSEDSYVTFTRRDDYWDKDDYTYDAKQITLRFYSDETAMYMDYQSGNLDAIYGIGDTTVSQIENKGNQGTVQYVSNNDVSLLMLNEDNQYLSDPKVRQAIAEAVDMSYITDIAYGSLGKTAYSHFASTFDCYTKHDGYTYDPDDAKKILKDAGYSDGEITLTWLSPDVSPQPDVGEAIQAQLTEIGITVNVETYDLATTLGMYIDGEGDIMMMTTNGGNPTKEPYVCLSAFASRAPFTCMSIEDETYNGYLQDGMNTVDESQRWEAYEKADQWLYDNYNAIPICETLSAIAYNDRITSFDQSAVGKGCIGNLKLAKPAAYFTESGT